MRAAEVVEILPLLQLVVEESRVVDHDTVQKAVELLSVDSVASLHLAVEPRGCRFDVDVANASIEYMPVELALKFGSVVRLNDLNLEGKALEQVVEELNGGLLVTAGKGPEHADSGAVVNGCELVMPLSRALDWLDELHVDLDPLTGQLLLVALPAVPVALVALRRWQPAHAQLVQDPPDAGGADRYVVISVQVHCDFLGSEVVVLAQIDDLRDHLRSGRLRAIQRGR